MQNILAVGSALVAVGSIAYETANHYRARQEISKLDKKIALWTRMVNRGILSAQANIDQAQIKKEQLGEKSITHLIGVVASIPFRTTGIVEGFSALYYHRQSGYLSRIIAIFFLSQLVIAYANPCDGYTDYVDETTTGLCLFQTASPYLARLNFYSSNSTKT